MTSIKAPGQEEPLTLPSPLGRGNAQGNSKGNALALFAVPVALIVSWAVHLWTGKPRPVSETHLYSLFMGGVFALAVIAGVVQIGWPGLRRWMQHMCPIIAVVFLLLSIWEAITSGFHLLPLPYFPSPAGVL